MLTRCTASQKHKKNTLPYAPPYKYCWPAYATASKAPLAQHAQNAPPPAGATRRSHALQPKALRRYRLRESRQTRTLCKRETLLDQN
jgi:hypothetical protein